MALTVIAWIYSTGIGVAWVFLTRLAELDGDDVAGWKIFMMSFVWPVVLGFYAAEIVHYNTRDKEES